MHKLQSKGWPCQWLITNAYINSDQWKVPLDRENPPRNRHIALKKEESPSEVSRISIKQTKVNQ
jgi:hypothetical protein